MKALYVICVALIVVNLGLLVYQTLPRAEAQAIGGSGGGTIALLEMFNDKTRTGLLAIIDTRREAMLIYGIVNNKVELLRKGGQIDLQREFKKLDEARKRNK